MHLKFCLCLTLTVLFAGQPVLAASPSTLNGPSGVRAESRLNPSAGLLEQSDRLLAEFHQAGLNFATEALMPEVSRSAFGGQSANARYGKDTSGEVLRFSAMGTGLTGNLGKQALSEALAPQITNLYAEYLVGWQFWFLFIAVLVLVAGPIAGGIIGWNVFSGTTEHFGGMILGILGGALGSVLLSLVVTTIGIEIDKATRRSELPDQNKSASLALSGKPGMFPLFQF